MKGSAILSGFAAAGLLAGCALTPPHGRTTADPVALAQRFDRPEVGFDYQAFCKELGIKSRMFTRAEDDPPIAVYGFALDPVGTNLWRMVVVSNGWKSEWQYLIFSRDHQNWRLLGHIDVPAQPYVEPDRRIERASDGRAWLVLTYVASWGTEVYDRKEAWYRLGQRGLRLQREVGLGSEG